MVEWFPPKCKERQPRGMGYLVCDKPAGHCEHNFVMPDEPPSEVKRLREALTELVDSMKNHKLSPRCAAKRAKAIDALRPTSAR